MYEKCVLRTLVVNRDFIARFSFGKETCDLFDKLLTCNPRERITAAEALDHDYFWTDPLPADPKKWGFAHYSPLVMLHRTLTTSPTARADPWLAFTSFSLPRV